MLDAIDAQIVQSLQLDGRASWTQIAQQIGIPTSTAFRRGTALLEGSAILIGTLATPDTYPEDGRVYEIRVRCRPGSQRAVAYRFARRPDTRWVAVITGQFDVSAELVVPRGVDFAEILIDQIQSDPDVLATDTALVLGEHNIANDWPRSIPAHDSKPLPEHICSQDHLDGTDRAILAQLREDGRRSYAAVATSLDLSENTVRRRCTEMFERRCARVVTLVQPYSLGYNQELLIRLDVLPQHTDSAAQVLAHQNGVHHIASNLGETSLVCELMLKSHHDLRAFLQDVVATLPGLTRMAVEIELIVYKRGFLRCPWVLDDFTAGLAGPGPGPAAPAS
jgi:DNA-binding Lrp family transcriptional regulator